MASSIRSICIVGPGLIGGSLGLAVQSGGFKGRIYALTRTAAECDAAVESGAVHDGSHQLDGLPAGISLYCITAPLLATRQILRRLRPRLADGKSIVTDVGSSKVSVMRAAHDELPDPACFVGGHPMAGSELSGIEHARADLFRGATTVLTPSSVTRQAAIDTVSQLWKMAGAHVVTMPAEQHDETVARVSHLPHALAALLMLLAERGDGLELASTGLLDATRIASGNPQLWEEILLSNRRQLRTAIGRMINDLTRLSEWLAVGEGDRIRRMLSRAARSREQWIARKYEQRDWKH